MHTQQGWSPGQRALLRFLAQQGVLESEPLAPTDGKPSNADLFAVFADAIEQERFVELVAEALRITAVDLATVTLMPDLLSLVPADVAISGEVIPIAQENGILEVAAANPLDLETAKALEFTSGLRVRMRVAPREDVCRAINQAYGGETEEPAEEVGAEEAGPDAIEESPIVESPIESAANDADSITEPTSEPETSPGSEWGMIEPATIGASDDDASDADGSDETLETEGAVATIESDAEEAHDTDDTLFATGAEDADEAEDGESVPTWEIEELDVDEAIAEATAAVETADGATDTGTPADVAWSVEETAESASDELLDDAPESSESSVGLERIGDDSEESSSDADPVTSLERFPGSTYPSDLSEVGDVQLDPSPIPVDAHSGIESSSEAEVEPWEATLAEPDTRETESAEQEPGQPDVIDTRWSGFEMDEPVTTESEPLDDVMADDDVTIDPEPLEAEASQGDTIETLWSSVGSDETPSTEPEPFEAGAEDAGLLEEPECGGAESEPIESVETAIVADEAETDESSSIDPVAVLDADTATSVADPSAAAAAMAGVATFALPEPDEAKETPPDTVPAPAVASRAAILIVSTDLEARLNVRAALEQSPTPPCVVTMRDESEARAALGLGGITIVMVDEKQQARTGGPLWRALEFDLDIGRVIVRSAAPPTGAGEWLSDDASPEDVAERILTLIARHAKQ